MKNQVFILMLILGCGFVKAQETEGATIKMEITNIENAEGQMLIGLYDSEGNWLNKTFKGIFGKIKNGRCTAEFNNVSDGTYAISVFHDENNNGELDTNFMGIPKEDTGASNNAPANFGPPEWEDAKFEVKGKTIKQTIKL
ncbi:hypothetical protein MNBD_BACTEROID03-2288 [hydrothermal vent metagenome]|uniref:DUF2141 domain-containing protein n=1 Tax=hydrothermal vent metagenome TaxID=652676 RepID=A0A3B0TTP3_9ZZZZ